MATTERLYKWVIQDTQEVIELAYKPEPGNELKVHKISHPDLGVFAAVYLAEEE